MVEQIAGNIQELIALYGLNVVAAIAILIIGRWAAKIVRRIIENVMMKTKVDITLVSFVASLSYVGLMAFVIIAALGQLGIQTTSFVAILGAAGLAVGLALQGSLSNFAAGVLMIIFKPFKVGDMIDGGGASGVVEKIEIFTTTLKTADNKTVIIPNAKIGGGNIVNHPTIETCQLDIPVILNYKDAFATIEKHILEILADDPKILKDPAPCVGISKFSESHITYSIKAWTTTADQNAASGNVMIKIKGLFEDKTLMLPID